MGRDAAFMRGRLRRADDVHRQHRSQAERHPADAALEGKYPQPCRRQSDGRRPPQLPGFQIGGGHAGKFRRQAEIRCQHEGNEPAGAPDHATGNADRLSGEQDARGQDQRKRHAGDDIGRQRIERALQAVFRLPGFFGCVRRSNGGFACRLVRVASTPCMIVPDRRGLIGLGFQDQGNHPQLLRRRRESAGQHARDHGREQDAHHHGRPLVAGRYDRVAHIVGCVMQDAGLRERHDIQQQ